MVDIQGGENFFVDGIQWSDGHRVERLGVCFVTITVYVHFMLYFYVFLSSTCTLLSGSFLGILNKDVASP